MIQKLLAMAAVVAVASPALAADLGPYRPPPPQTYEPPDVPVLAAQSWRGFYIGLNGGYAWGDGGVDVEGWHGGAQLGYNAQFGRFVLGIEGDFNAADIDGSGFNQATADVDWFSTLRARAGLATEFALVYVTGGFAWADVNYSALGQSDSDTAQGYALGGGLERALAPHWTTKLEYLYVDLDDKRFSAGMNSTTVDPDFHTVRLGINYKF